MGAIGEQWLARHGGRGRFRSLNRAQRRRLERIARRDLARETRRRGQSPRARRRELAALAGALVALMATPAADAAVTVQLQNGNELHVTSDNASDSMTISCAGGVAQVAPLAPSAVACSDVAFVIVDGGQGNDTVDVSGVSTATFPNISDFLGVGVRTDEGNDEITGSPLFDSLDGGLAGDSIEGGDGGGFINDTEGPGNTIRGGNGDDFLTTAPGGDTIDGGLGDDGLFDTPASHGSYVLTATALTGFAGPDSLSSIEFATLNGGAAADTIDASAFPGRAELRGAGGTDSLLGGAGNDFLTGGAGNDAHEGGSGEDTVIDSEASGAVTLTDGLLTHGGETNTLATIEVAELSTNGPAINFDGSAYTGTTQVSGSNNVDTFVGGSGHDRFFGGDGNDTMTGNGGDDEFTGEEGDDSILAGPGFDTIETSFAQGNVVLGGTTMIGGADVGTDVFNNEIEGAEIDTDDLANRVDAGAFDRPATIFGNDGPDTLIGSEADDSLIGSDGVDQLSGDQGNDTVDGGLQNDAIAGDDGDDLLFEQEQGNHVLTDSQLNGVAGVDNLSGIERANLGGTDGADSIDATPFSGAVTLAGLQGGDQFPGVAVLPDGSDTLRGGQGPAALFGLNGDDSLLGGPAADTVNGGPGADTLGGGGALDSFLCGGAADTLLDATFDESFADGCVGPPAPPGSGNPGGGTPGGGSGGAGGAGAGAGAGAGGAGSGAGSNTGGLAQGTFGMRRGRARMTARLDLQVPLTNTTQVPFRVNVDATETRTLPREVSTAGRSKRRRFRLRSVRNRLIRPGQTVTITLRAPRADAAALRRTLRRRGRLTRRPRVTITNRLTAGRRSVNLRVTRRR